VFDQVFKTRWVVSQRENYAQELEVFVSAAVQHDIIYLAHKYV